MMFHFDPTVTLGNILTAIVFITALIGSVARAYNLIDRRMATFESTIMQHTELLKHHTTSMERQDALLLDISGQMNRIVGRLEAFSPGQVAEAAATALAVVEAAGVTALKKLAAAESAALTAAAAAATEVARVAVAAKEAAAKEAASKKGV